MPQTTAVEGRSADSPMSFRQFIDWIPISETISIIVISVVGYATLYRFQAGFLNFFNVPTQYIGFSLSAIVIASSVVITGAIILVLSIPLIIWILWKIRVDDLFRAYGEIFLAVYLAFVLIVLAALRWLPVSLVEAIILAATIFIVGALVARWWLRRQLKRESSGEEKPSAIFVGIKLKKLPYWIVVTLLMLLLFMVLADLAGYTFASYKKDYSIAETSPETLVVYATAEHAVLSQFDRTTKTIYSDYTILMTEDFDGTFFHPENLGRMEVKPLSGRVKIVPTLTPSSGGSSP